MKRLVVLTLIFLTLTACGKIHKDVDEDLANDSIQVLNILIEAMENNVLADDLPSDKVKVVNSYGDKYQREERESTLIFNETEEDIITFTLATITRYTMYTGLESDKTKIIEGKESVEEMIKTGKDYVDLNS